MDRHQPKPAAGRRRGLLAVGLVLAFGAWLLPVTADAVTDPSAASAPVAGPPPPPVHTTGPVDLEADTVELDSTDAASTSSERSRPDAPDVVAAGSVHVVDLVPGTQMIGFSWTGAPDAAIEFRTRDAGTWSVWEDFEADPGEAPDDGSEREVGEPERSGDAPVWLGGKESDRVEIRIGDQDLVEFEVLRMHWDESEVADEPVDASPDGSVPTIRSTSAAARSTAPQPPINPRSSWAPGGWRSDISGCGSSVPYNSSISHAVVHHTATGNTYSQSQVPGIIAGMYRYHTDSLRWCDLAYNFVVDKYGGIWQGRSGDLNRFPQGGHARGFNSTSTGVTLLGQYHPGASPAAARPTDVQIASLQRVLAWKLGQAGLDATGTSQVTSLGSTRYPSGTTVTLPVINPHQATSSTVCPGQYVMERMTEIRNGAKALQGGTAPAWAPFATATAFVDQQARDLFGRPANGMELWTFVSRFNEGRSAGQVGAEMATQRAATAASEPVVRLYHVAFNRVPDSGGFAVWRSRLRDGRSIHEVAGSFAGSQEFRDRYAHLGNAAYVTALYQHALNRAPDLYGHLYHTDHLNRGVVTRAGVLVRFSESPEFRTNSLPRVRTIATYHAMLGRIPPSANLANWSARPPEEMITAILGLAEYRDRARLS